MDMYFHMVSQHSTLTANKKLSLGLWYLVRDKSYQMYKINYSNNQFYPHLFKSASHKRLQSTFNLHFPTTLTIIQSAGSTF
ncbi:parn [Acrasis kona]|uniref:Parn n=1 Tax=Acrasis kona TaxID=1008807 RepID=A0AAW2YKG8_9EUKA